MEERQVHVVQIKAPRSVPVMRGFSKVIGVAPVVGLLACGGGGAGSPTGASSGSQPQTPTSIPLPSTRAHHALVYEEAAARVILTGGSTPIGGGQSFTFYDDAWAFDGRGWTALGPSGAQRSGQAAAYDSRLHRVMSFGGYCTCRAEDNGRHNDLLRLESGRWQPVTSLSQRPTTDAGMVYDPVRDRLVMYGGSGGSQQALSDTWEFDGTTWRQTATAGPGALVGFSMVYDAKDGRTLLFGGFTTNPGAPSGDLWAYNDASWQRLSTNGPARHSAGAAFDTRRGLLIVFGGVDASGFIGDTWSWDGSTWQRLAAAGPEARAMGYLAYDKSRDRVVMFGGRKSGADLNDTWEWDGSGWARFVAPSR